MPSSRTRAAESASRHIARIPVASDDLTRRATRDLEHLPGPPGHWLWGNSRDFLPNPGKYIRGLRRRHGNCFTVGVLRNRRHVVLAGPAANRLVLLDPDDRFSSRRGWEVVDAYFPGFVLLRDFADHRQHRRMMTPLFKPEALQRYLAEMQPVVGESVRTWPETVDIYPAMKRLTLEVALRVFAGFGPGSAGEAVYGHLATVLDNVLAPPGVRRWRGLRARDRLRRTLRAVLPERRCGTGVDLFTRLAVQADESGRRLSDRDVVDHVLGLLFAAHDTTTSALTTICIKLAEDPVWQGRLREECRAVREDCGEPLDYESLDRLPLTDAFFRETLRQYSPLQMVPRRSVREFRFEGHRIPANAPILLFPQATHFDAEFFPDPERFDPLRFVDAPAPEPFAFIPFGRGSHMCLGMHFAAMEVKAVLYRLLLDRELRLEERGERTLNYVPVVRPARPVRLHQRPVSY